MRDTAFYLSTFSKYFQVVTEQFYTRYFITPD